ncbi:MAG TPA: hypothetical protein VFA26_11705 [Gemmataceae bacterium]|nr:hypothetical protein [Gemmataceae bacterium]
MHPAGRVALAGAASLYNNSERADWFHSNCRARRIETKTRPPRPGCARGPPEASHANLFAPTELRHRTVAQAPKAGLRDRLLVRAQAGDTEALNRLNRHVRLREAAFHAAPVAQLVVGLQGAIPPR